MFGQNPGPINRFLFCTAIDRTYAFIQGCASNFFIRSLPRGDKGQRGTGISESMTTSGWVMKYTKLILIPPLSSSLCGVVWPRAHEFTTKIVSTHGSEAKKLWTNSATCRCKAVENWVRVSWGDAIDGFCLNGRVDQVMGQRLSWADWRLAKIPTITKMIITQPSFKRAQTSNLATTICC